jgi:hypothetical protein
MYLFMQYENGELLYGTGSGNELFESVRINGGVGFISQMGFK